MPLGRCLLAVSRRRALRAPSRQHLRNAETASGTGDVKLGCAESMTREFPMDSFRRCVLLAFTCFSAACSARMADNVRDRPLDGRTTYYVSTSGNDANDGSVTTPRRTIARVNATSLSPGDTVAFEGGSTFAG